MNKKGMSMASLFIVSIMVVVFAMVQSGVDSQTVDKTITSLNWDYLKQNISSLNSNVTIESGNFQGYINKIIYKTIDFGGYIFIELSKFAMTFARDNPDIINFKVLFVLLMLSLIAPLIFPAFKIIVSLILIIKEYFAKKREKRNEKR